MFKLLSPQPAIVPAVAPEHDYVGRICVALFETIVMPDARPALALAVTESGLIPIEHEDGPAIGYFQDVGFRCVAGDVVDVLEFAAADGEVHWGRSEWNETHVDSLPRAIRRAAALGHDAFWYRGPKEYFRRW